MREEVVIKLPEPKPLPRGVCVCPRCGGMRAECNGRLMISTTEVRYTPCGPCILCHGSGKVRIEAYEDEVTP